MSLYFQSFSEHADLALKPQMLLTLYDMLVCLQYSATLTVFCQPLNSLTDPGFGKTPCISGSGY